MSNDPSERASWLTNYTTNTMDSAPLGIKRGKKKERKEGENRTRLQR